MYAYLFIYAFIIADLLCLSAFFTLSWFKYKRRLTDKLFSVVGSLLAMSYFLFNLEFLQVKSKPLQLGVDIGIALYLAYFFIVSITREIKKK